MGWLDASCHMPLYQYSRQYFSFIYILSTSDSEGIIFPVGGHLTRQVPFMTTNRYQRSPKRVCLAFSRSVEKPEFQVSDKWWGLLSECKSQWDLCYFQLFLLGRRDEGHRKREVVLSTSGALDSLNKIYLGHAFLGRSSRKAGEDGKWYLTVIRYALSQRTV